MRLNLLILLLSFLPLCPQAKPASTIINGKTFFIYPFQVSRPSCKPELSKGIHYVERWSDGIRSLERLTVEAEISSRERKRLAWVRKEAPWLYYEDWHHQVETPVPSPDSLPDGDYVQYYQGLPYVDGDTLKFRSGQIAALFQLRNNLPEGSFVLFTSTGDTAQTGNYKLGQPDGDWVLQSYRYAKFHAQIDYKAYGRRFIRGSQRLLHTRTTMTYRNGALDGLWEGWSYDYTTTPHRTFLLGRTAYKNGVLNGIYESYYNGLPEIKGAYTDGIPSGEWFRYALANEDDYLSGKPLIMQLICHYIIPDEPKTGYGPIIRQRFFESENDTLLHGFATLKDFDPDKSPFTYRNEVIFSSFYDIPQPDSAAAVFSYNRYVPDTWVRLNSIYLGKSRQLITRQQAIDSMGYQLRYSFYEEFYPNGQLLLRFRSHEGQLEREDTIFWNNGQAANVVNYLPKTQQYEQRLFDREGRLVKLDLFDSKGAFIETRVNRTGIRPAFIRLGGLDYVYRQGVYAYCMPYNQPAFSGVTVIEAAVRDTDSSFLDLTVFDPATHLFTKRITRGPFSILTEGIVDSAGMVFTGSTVCRLGDFSRTRQVTQDQSSYQFAQHIPDRVMSFRYFGFYGDSVPLLYRGQPYTGKVELHYDSDSTYYRYAPGMLRIFVERDATGMNAFWFNHLINSLNYCDDYYSTDSYRKQGPVSGNFTNGFADGNWKFSFPNGKLQCRFTLTDGEVNGKIQSYSMAYPQAPDPVYVQPAPTDTFPTQATYYLRNEFVYEKGDLLSSETRDWTGSIVNSYDAVTGASFQRKGNEITRVVHHNDSMVIAVTNELAGNERLMKRTAIKNPPAYIPDTTSAGETMVISETAEVRGSPRETEHYYYETGELFQLKRTDSTGKTVFFETYFPNGDRMEKVYWIEGEPSAYEHWENGSVKRRFEFHPEDSLTFGQLHWLRPADKKNGLHFPIDLTQHGYSDRQPINCRQLNYDPNGTIRSEGELRGLVKYETWNYYDEDGKRVAEIDYTVPLLILDSTDLHVVHGEVSADDKSVLVFEMAGKRRLFGPTGELLAEQWIIELYSNYSCVQDNSYETRNYYTILENDSTLHLRNGFIRHRDENGMLQCEGPSVQGLPEGFWKFYNPDGTIREAGLYHNGKRNGRWLSGDLSKVNYLGDLCIDPDQANSREILLLLQKELDITVTYYNMGEQLSREYFNVDTGH